MYYLSTSYLLFFFLFSLIHPLPCASSNLEDCQIQSQCGNISAGFPFWGGDRPDYCGHPWLQLGCIRNIASLFLYNQRFYVLHLKETSNTLTLARPDHLGSFCSSAFNTTPLPPDLYELAPTYKSLTVFYLCNSSLSYQSSYTCPNKGPISVSETPDYQNSCGDSFTINVPKSFVPEEKELNITNLENVLSKGFEVKLKIDEKACQDCSSPDEFCSFKNFIQVCCKNSIENCFIKNTTQVHPLITHHPPDDNELHRRCSASFECGDQRELYYPFWIDGREDCGHPDFKLYCSGGFAELSISSVKYRILEANYTSGVIRLARSEYIGDLCPQNPLNVPFNETVLPFVPGTAMLTIYYDCSAYFSQTISDYLGELDCEDDDARNYYEKKNPSSYLLPWINKHLNDFRGSCNRNVSVPASGPALDTLQRNSSTVNLKNALENGFQLGLNQECINCTDSGGACGYNQNSSRFACYSINASIKEPHKGNSFGAGAKIGLGGAALLFLILALTLFLLIRRRITSNDQQIFDALIPLQQYSYAQVTRITKSFAEVVGKGGFGIVYRGILSDSRMVAVKVLKDSKGTNSEDFVNEVASMSQASHVNIVTLLGYCSEGSKRAIIYEFLENGSLDKFISSMTSMNTDWKALYRIALGVARGLEYLHHGCRTRIVHFDIKPQNVLLDDNLCPKVADFGLAKLCSKKESILSLLDTRGTIGYIAPELFSRMYGRVSHKSDVYSYGMLVLEMIGARNKARTDQHSASDTSSMYFPEWIYKDLEQGDKGKLNGNIITCEEEEIAKKMTLVGLWCIQPSPADRPLMNRVVEMMEGSLDDLEVPPRPVFPIPAAPIQESSTLSQDISESTEVDIEVHNAY